MLTCGNVFLENSHKIVILEPATFSILSRFLHPTRCFSVLQKSVILSEAPRRSPITKGLLRGVKDPGDACWQMLFGAFRPQTTRETKKSQPLSGALHRFIPRPRAGWRGVEEPVLSVAEGTPRMLILPMPFGAFQPPKPPYRILLRYPRAGHGYIFLMRCNHLPSPGTCKVFVMLQPSPSGLG